MRKAPGSGVGPAGRSFVASRFEQSNWGVSPVGEEHDLGTDLWVNPRDSTGEDLQCLLGVQVKTSANRNGKYFRSPRLEGGQTVGWWFSDDNPHFDYWCSHSSPHIVVLVDFENQEGYWAHLREDARIRHARTSKIFVAASNKIDVENIEQIARIAAASTQFEGSIWDSSPSQIPDSAKLRTAILAPRLVSHHPNKVPHSVSHSQAIAMLMQLRVDELNGHPLHDRKPIVPDRADNHGVWEWRLFAALKDYLEGGSLDGVESLHHSTSEPHLKAASGALLCGLLMEDGAASRSLDVASKAKSLRGYGSVDLAWLEVHAAWAHLELGDQEAAARIASHVEAGLSPSRIDPTIGAIRAAAADLMFTSGAFTSDRLERTLNANDTVTSWWRDGTLGSGAQKAIDSAFNTWVSSDTAETVDTRNAWLRLRGICLVSAVAAHRSGWSQAMSLLAKHQLISFPGDLDQFASALSALRTSGHEKVLRKVVERCRREGPIEPVVAALSEVDLAKSTKSSLRGDLSLISSAGDVTPVDEADRHVSWLIDQAKKGNRWASFGNGTVWLPHAVLEVIPDLMNSISTEATDALRSHIIDMPPQRDSLTDQDYARIISNVPIASWSRSEVRRLSSRKSHGPEMSRAIARVRAHHSPAYRRKLVPKIASGDFDALSEFGDLTEIPSDAAGEITRVFAERVRVLIRNSSSGSYSVGAPSEVQVLTLLCLSHPKSAVWDPVLSALRSPSGDPVGIENSLRLLAYKSVDIPIGVRAEILSAATALAQAEDPGPRLFDRGDVRGAAKHLVSAINSSEIDFEGLIESLDGTSVDQEVLVRALSRRKGQHSLELIAVLSRLGDPSVRAVAAYEVARWAGASSDPSVTVVLSRLAGSHGTWVARSIASALRDAPYSDALASVARRLLLHASAEARGGARDYLLGHGVEEPDET